MANFYAHDVHVCFLKEEKELYSNIEKASEKLGTKTKNETIKKLVELGLSVLSKVSESGEDVKEQIANLFSENKKEDGEQSEKEMIAWQATDLQNRMFGDVLLVKSMLSSLFEVMRLKLNDADFVKGTEINPTLYKLGLYSSTPEYLRGIEKDYIKKE